MSQPFDSAADEMRERAIVLSESAERMRKEADAYEEMAADLRAKAERNERIAREYRSLLPKRPPVGILTPGRTMSN